ncbi:MAG: hypothetical protein HOV66_11530 [Streptomycetaceae bacterium]|nr:hypothetical protein [Streptomycetaceae bacterium]
MLGDGWVDTAYGRTTLDVYENRKAASTDDGETPEHVLREKCAAEFG